MKLDHQAIEIMGSNTIIYGCSDDAYFKNLQDYAGQNSCFINELLKLKVNSTIIDIGANIGLTTVAASRCVPNGKVIAIEPSPIAYQCLLKTVNKNKLPNVTILNIGVGEVKGNLNFVESDFLAGSYFTLDTSQSNTLIVNVLPLDAIIDSEQLQDVDLIKIDVEGFELDVLLGAQNTVERFNPRFVMEFNSFALTANRNISPRRLLDFILHHYGKFDFIRDGVISTVTNEIESRDFMYSNMAARGCVDDIAFGGS